MAQLAVFLISLISSIGAYLAQYVGKKVAFWVAMAAALATLTAGFFVSIQALVSALVVTAPPQLCQIAGWLLPSNWSTCLAAYISARILLWLYSYNMTLIRLRYGL